VENDATNNSAGCAKILADSGFIPNLILDCFNI